MIVANTSSEFYKAITACDVETVKKMIDAGANVNDQSPFNNTPLHAAIQSLAITQLLLQAGANPNIANRRNCLPLHNAALRNTASLHCLMAVTDRKVKGEEKKTLLHFISNGGVTEFIVKLISDGAAVNERDENGITPLMEAAEQGREATVNILMEEGANMSLIDKQGKNASVWARDKGHVQLADMLFQASKKVKI